MLSRQPCMRAPALCDTKPTVNRGRCAHRSARVYAYQEFSAEGPSDSPQIVDDVTIPTRMNTIPHAREMRRFFYNDISKAIVQSLANKQTRMKARVTVPETNPEMDVYRIGTLLEMVREIATQVAEDGRRVKICVQGSMGQGVFQALPLSLSGVSRIMRVMDWGDVADFVSFGEVGAAEIDESDVYVLIAPQNIVGGMILTNLAEMVEAAEKAGKAVVLVNPILKDVPSANGVMGIRGRAERMAFSASFYEAYHFRLLYVAGSFYPIVGAMRYASGGKWQVFKRCDITRATEEYQLWGEFDSEPDGAQITKCLDNRIPLRLRGLETVETQKGGLRWW